MYTRPPMQQSYVPEQWNSQGQAPMWNAPQNPLQQFPATQEGQDPWSQFVPILAQAAGKFILSKSGGGKDMPGMLTRGGSPAPNPAAPPGLIGGQPNQLDRDAIIRMLAGGR